jgi:pheromone a factor receptor
MPDYPYTVFAAIGWIVCIPLAYFNWKIPGRPWAPLILIGWLFFNNLLSFIDSVLWTGSDSATWWDGKVYCDIGSRVKSEYLIGVPAALIGICRFLAAAIHLDPVQTTLNQTQRRRNITDLLLGVFLPIVNVGLKQIVTSPRYYIFGIRGCTTGLDDSWPSILLYFLWAPVLTIIATGYAGILS